MVKRLFGGHLRVGADKRISRHAASPTSLSVDNLHNCNLGQHLTVAIADETRLSSRRHCRMMDWWYE